MATPRSTSPRDIGVATKLAELIGRDGPITFDRFMDAALYDLDGGFFATGEGAGRAGGAFITSPEVGSLFGALVSRALDRYWEELGRPDPFFVVECGAGRGRLAADVLASTPACASSLRYVLVERSAALRELQHEILALEPAQDALGEFLPASGDEDPRWAQGNGPIIASLDELPVGPLVGVVISNELMDNLPFRIAEVAGTFSNSASRGHQWREVRVGIAADSCADAPKFVEVVVPADEDLIHDANQAYGDLDLSVRARLPVANFAATWMSDVASVLARGFVVIIDYAQNAAVLAGRGQDGWLRTYRNHQRGESPLVAPGSQDITSDVALEHLDWAGRHSGLVEREQIRQGEWLERLGIDELVAQARATWDAKAAIGDLEAMAARSRVTEAAALMDAAGLGAHRVIVFTRGLVAGN